MYLIYLFISILGVLNFGVSYGIVNIEVLQQTDADAKVFISSITKQLSKNQPNINPKLPTAKNRKFIPFKFINAEEFKVSAKSGAVLDYENNVLLFNNNADQPTPIASITKLMTALVFLDHNPGWEHIYKIQKQDRREGGKIYLFLGEKITVQDLFYLSIVSSANTATVALVSSTGMSEKEFVEKMNQKAINMNLHNTHFTDPIGLSDYNISTAYEVAFLIKKALSNQDIYKATITKQYEFSTIGNRKKQVDTTNYLLKHFPSNGIKIIGGKTGYTDVAGYCFAGEFINKNGNKIISVILGSKDNNSRFTETKDLVEWTYDSFRFP